ncbi:MAG: glycosyltransferase [Rickettsia endosymbiont of Argas persicus]
MDKNSYQQRILKNNFIFYAPSIHTGGGLILLQEILNTKDFTNNFRRIYLDESAKNKLNLSSFSENIIFIKSRLLTEWKLKQNCKTNDTILCFNGLPPLFPVKGKVVVFLQNRILLEPIQGNNYSIFNKLSIFLKKAWLNLRGSKKNIKYIVQTPSMLYSAKKFLGEDINIEILPFASQYKPIQKQDSNPKKFDFIYPASGELHKNHLNLFKAWKILADIGIKPSLALTINAKLYSELSQELQRYKQEYQLDITNLGEVQQAEILNLYTQVSALIYPSKSESFGLPLIEAKQYNLPILASELDYVRDVVNPIQTFDPNSPLSIARAVRRFLNNNEDLIDIKPSEEFLKKIYRI